MYVCNYVYFMFAIFLFYFCFFRVLRGIKLRLFLMARNKRICFWARVFVVHRANTRFVLRFVTRKQDFRGTLRIA
jgi:hypothetical protein